jgi:hypothetical protein
MVHQAIRQYLTVKINKNDGKESTHFDTQN